MNILYLIAVMLAPVTMIFVGLRWKISPPPYRSSGLAYSTELTRSSPEIWSTAHRHCSKLWLRIGIVSGFASGILIALFFESFVNFWLWPIVGQMILFCISVFMIDLLLKSQFEDDDKKSK